LLKVYGSEVRLCTCVSRVQLGARTAADCFYAVKIKINRAVTGCSQTKWSVNCDHHFTEPSDWGPISPLCDL